ncbi:unnamed protein product [Ostreobium quekettii]|uniref:Ubiquitin-like domain-containing protein n=1 Tax=Ostreobium quekettii TaxID=121088 RepID=A0A8S1J8P5_9CHLO|nr:unnamed protein product [Ostreobium quekettii]
MASRGDAHTLALSSHLMPSIPGHGGSLDDWDDEEAREQLEVLLWLVGSGPEPSHCRQPPVAAPQMSISVRDLAGNHVRVNAEAQRTVAEVKACAASALGGDPALQVLAVAGEILQEAMRLQDYGVAEGCTLCMAPWEGHAANAPLLLEPRFLAPQHDFDLTGVPNDGVALSRGGEAYVRPFGWRRHALAVDAKYSDTTWLDGRMAAGQWPVGYHGTTLPAARAIVAQGFRLCMSRRATFGLGVYTTPDVDYAERYAEAFEHAGRRFKVVIQARVNPAKRRRVERRDPATGAVANIWVNPNERDVRPYGVLVREV